MGFFSWETQDSHESIANRYSCKETFPVYMRDNKGRVWREDAYEGYGVFGGKDFYELLAEMNGGKTRAEGINLAFGSEPYLSPNLSRCEERRWENRAPKDCELQGYFY